MKKYVLISLFSVLGLSACQNIGGIGVHTPDQVIQDNAESGGPYNEDGVPNDPSDGAMRDQNLDTGGIIAPY